MQKTIIISCEEKDWENQIVSCIDDFNKIENLSPIPEILEEAHQNDMELYPSALYYHSKKELVNSKSNKGSQKD